jgi:hypothetical protein
MKKTKCNKGGRSNIKRFEILENNEPYFLATNALLLQPTTCMHKNPTNNKKGILLTHSCSNYPCAQSPTQKENK